jgi:hypothetical protein
MALPVPRSLSFPLHPPPSTLYHPSTLHPFALLAPPSVTRRRSACSSAEPGIFYNHPIPPSPPSSRFPFFPNICNSIFQLPRNLTPPQTYITLRKLDRSVAITAIINGYSNATDYNDHYQHKHSGLLPSTPTSITSTLLSVGSSRRLSHATSTVGRGFFQSTQSHNTN